MTTFGAAPSYSKVEGLIISKVCEFVSRYHTDWEDTKSAALYGYVLAERSYDPDVAEFTTWVGYKVWKAMLSWLRQEARQTGRRTLTEELDDVPDRPHPAFDLDELELSADARDACRLVLDEAAHLRLNLALVGGPPTPGNVRQAVRECLHDLGRSAKQVKTAFAEIRSVL